MWADVDSSLIIIYSPFRFPRTEEKNAVGFFISFNPQQRHQQLIRYHRLHLPERPFTTIAAAAAISPYDIFRPTDSQSLFFLRHPDWKIEMREVGEEGLIATHNNCRSLLLAVPTVDQ